MAQRAGLQPSHCVASDASSSFQASLRPQAQPCWRCSRATPRRWRQRQQQAVQPRAALLDPPPFDPAKLRVEYLPGGREQRLAAGRRYTLTHNDVTGSLQLSIGREYNRRQLDGWYTRMLRDEILAEWQDTPAPTPPGSSTDGGGGSSSGGDGGGAERRAPQPSLHVFCHVSGEELWPAPPQLRSFIFQREMALVLDTIAHAEREALAAAPALLAAPVYVHLRSDIPALDRVVEWGRLGERATWRTAQSSVMRSLLSSVLGTMDEDADATDGTNGSWSRGNFTSSSAAWDGGAGGGEGLAGGWGGGSWDDGDPSAPFAQQQQQQQHAGEAEADQRQGLATSSSDDGGEGQQVVAFSNGAAAAATPAGSSLGGACKSGAASLAGQQLADCSSSTWLGATAVGDGQQGRRRGPGAEVVPAAISSRQR